MIQAFLVLLAGFLTAFSEIWLRRQRNLFGGSWKSWKHWTRLLDRRRSPDPAATALLFSVSVGIVFLSWEALLRHLFQRSAPDLFWVLGLVFFGAALGYRLVALSQGRGWTRSELFALWFSWLMISGSWILALLLTPWVFLRSRFLKWKAPVSVSQ